ncbi:MAG: cytochrome P450 [Bacteroidota bacterium]
MDPVAEIKWNPYTPGYFANPYPHLKECRENNPVHRGAQNGWTIFRYKEVSEILRNPDLLVSNLSEYFKSKESVIFKNYSGCPHLAAGTSHWPMYLNGEIHKRVRVAMTKAMSRPDLDEIIRNASQETVQKFEGLTKFDLTEFCAEFIKRVICVLFNIPISTNLAKLEHYSNHLARSQDIFVSKQEYLAINEAFEWGKGIFSRNDYMDMIRESLADLNLNEEQLYSIFAISVMAAFETSKDNLSLSFLELLKNPPLYEDIERMSKTELNGFIDELFRYSSPLQFTVRVNEQPLEIGGVQIESGSKIYLSLASANRDEEIFENPDSILPYRKSNPHLAFGGGVHRCLGAQIAKRELQIALKPMASLFQNYELVADPVWSRQIFMRTVKKVQIRQKSGN